jgi:tetratricopeptide (TPR) repeat protein
VPALARGQVRDSVSALERAFDLEGKSQFRAAAREYRGALAQEGTFSIALLGLERCLHEIASLDSLIPVLDSVLRVRPADPVARPVQLRSLLSLGQNQRLREAFESWRATAPADAAPFREFARVLIDVGRMAAADSVLREAERTLPDSRQVALELAQVRAALGFWDESAVAWRAALEQADYLTRAAVIALAGAPADQRPAIRELLMVRPAIPAVRRALAELELGWGSAHNGWTALRDLVPGDSARNAWLDFADRAEAAEGWLAARDALLAALGDSHDAELVSRAARAAVSGGDSEGAVQLIELESRGRNPMEAARSFAVPHVRALASLGRPADAAAAAANYSRFLEPSQRGQVQQEVALGWVRAGDVGRARQSLQEAGVREGSGDVAGWMALYAGDLRGARGQLRGYGDATHFPGTVTAMAILGRTRSDSSSDLGNAFVALARADTMASAASFAAAAVGLEDVGSLLLVTAARLLVVRDTAAAVENLKAVLARYPHSPEAAESDLEIARILRRRGDKEGAIKHLEHLILTYPASALLPQARRELEAVKRTAAGAGEVA